MYKPGTKFEVKLRIKQGDAVIEQGIVGVIKKGISKMVGKSYQVELEDGRTTQLHIVIMNNHTMVIQE